MSSFSTSSDGSVFALSELIWIKINRYEIFEDPSHYLEYKRKCKTAPCSWEDAFCKANKEMPTPKYLRPHEAHRSMVWFEPLHLQYEKEKKVYYILLKWNPNYDHSNIINNYGATWGLSIYIGILKHLRAQPFPPRRWTPVFEADTIAAAPASQCTMAAKKWGAAKPC